MTLSAWWNDLTKKIYKWPIGQELLKYRVGSFDQRQILLSEYRNDDRIPVGACPGLSFEWMKIHSLDPNQSSEARLLSLDKAPIWNNAAELTKSFNNPQIKENNKKEIINAPKAFYQPSMSLLQK